jgi:hypothetical protein
MQKIKTNFGFKTISIGNITIYTGKIRIQAHAQNLAIALQNYAEHLTFRETYKNRFYTTISFETTSFTLNKDLMRAIMLVMKDIAQARLEVKYSNFTNQEITTEIVNDLMCF